VESVGVKCFADTTAIEGDVRSGDAAMSNTLNASLFNSVDTFPRTTVRARKRTPVHLRAETLPAEKIGALSYFSGIIAN